MVARVGSTRRVDARIIPTVRTVSAYSLWFPKPSSAGEVWREMTSSITAWYAGREPDLALPPTWHEGLDSRLTPIAGHALECAVSAVEGTPGPLRELRWSYPDVDDDTLIWTIDAATLPGEGTIFTLVLRIASADFELLPARVKLPSPRVVRNLVARGDAHIGVHPVYVEPWYLDADGVVDLTVLLLEPSRRHPIIVISPEFQTDDVYAVDAVDVSNVLAGLASVFVLRSQWAGFALTDELGKRLSCYGGAVRVYWPRFTRQSDPFAHPLWLPPEIREIDAREGFSRMLLRMIAGAASFRFVEPEPVRAFRARLESTRVTRLRGEKQAGYEELFEEYVRLDAHARELREQLDAAVTENAALRGELASRWIPDAERRSVAREPSIDDRPEPTTVVEAVEEARRRTQHVVYLPEALESARESPFRQPDRVFSALLAVDDVARRWAEQLAGGVAIGSRRDAFRQRGFEYKEDISATTEGKWGTEYTYQYEGNRVLFAPHITIGAKGADRCLSIHLHWDEVKRKAVIAHVGRHKTNTRS